MQFQIDANKQYFRDYSGKKLKYSRSNVRIILVGLNQHHKSPSKPSQAILKIQSGEKGAREYNMYSRLKHPNISKAYCHYIEHNKSYLFLELGKYDLSQDIKTRARSVPIGFYSEEDLIKVFFKISKAVAFMHSLSIAHRDIKPLNIIYNFDDEIKLIDLGEAKFVHKDTEQHTVIGTIPYMSPDLISSYEQNRSNRDPFADDIWAIGITVLELAMLDSIYNVTRDRNHIKDIVPELLGKRNYSESFISLVMKTLEPNTRLRINADELLREIYDFDAVCPETVCVYFPAER